MSTLKWPHPVYIRLSRGDEPLITKKNRKFIIGKSVIIKKSSDFPNLFSEKFQKISSVRTGFYAADVLEFSK